MVDAIASLRSVMDGLSSKSEEIRGIVNTIHDIADQTNLLAPPLMKLPALGARPYLPWWRI